MGLRRFRKGWKGSFELSAGGAGVFTSAVWGAHSYFIQHSFREAKSECGIADYSLRRQDARHHHRSRWRYWPPGFSSNRKSADLNSGQCCHQGNQGRLQEDVSTYFTSTLSPDIAVVSIDGDPGRIETGALRVTDEIDWLKERPTWSGLQSILAVTATRESGHKVTAETRYFIRR